LDEQKTRRGKGRPTDVGEGELKDRIFREAARIFSKRGYRSATVQDIVVAAGATKPVLYYYFQNKEGLYRALLDYVLAKRRQLIEKIEEDCPDPRERLVSLFQGIFTQTLDSPELALFDVTAYFAPSDEAPAVDTSLAGRELFRAFRRAAEQAIEAGTIRGNPFEIARVFLGIKNSYLITHLDEPSFNLIGPGAAERIVSMVWDGIGAEQRSG
jgi:TetR/AcrR family transcriptional regulator